MYKSKKNNIKNEYLLFIKVNPEANVCPNFNLTLMVNFTLIPLINY